MEERNDLIEVVDDKILELKSHDGIPLRQILHIREIVHAILYFSLVRREILQEKARVIVLETVLRHARLPSCRRIESTVVSDESTLFQRP